jgi:drug/metabolite transporter (DMT)-like permease
MNKSTVVGIIAAVLAAVSWSLGFIVPFVIGSYSVFDFTLVEFLFSGVLGSALLWKNSSAVRRLELADWLSACSLGVIGYVGYFLAVMGAAKYAGPVIGPAFLGLVPVVLAVAGNLREHTVSWRALALPLTFATVGLLLVNGSGIARSTALEMRTLAIGVPLAILAVALWTAFGLMNQSALAKRPQMDAGVWTALIMVGAGAAMLIFLPVGLLAGLFEIPRLGLRWEVAAPLILWSAVLAVFANFGGAMAWTFASQRLPVALSAQLIVMEPTSATMLGLFVRRRWPAPAEVVGMVVLLVGVIIAIGIFTRPARDTPRPAAA